MRENGDKLAQKVLTTHLQHEFVESGKIREFPLVTRGSDNYGS